MVASIFVTLCGFFFALVAVKVNVVAKQSSRKMFETELARWFSNARDRGHGRRFFKGRPQTCSVASELGATTSIN